MRVMSKQQEKLFNKLVRIADGDVGLVKEALESATRSDPAAPPNLENIVYYIMQCRGYEPIEREGHVHFERRDPMPA